MEPGQDCKSDSGDVGPDPESVSLAAG